LGHVCKFQIIIRGQLFRLSFSRAGNEWSMMGRIREEWREKGKEQKENRKNGPAGTWTLDHGYTNEAENCFRLYILDLWLI
jgi:hypothetical protein